MSTAMSTDSLWRVPPDAGLRLRFWDDECVLLHGASGATHRLPAAVGRLLERLLAAPASVAALSEALDLHADDVAGALSELASLGITQPPPAGQTDADPA